MWRASAASYDLPIGQGKPWLGGIRGAADKLVSGWQVNSIVTLLSGFPFTARRRQQSVWRMGIPAIRTDPH